MWGRIVLRTTTQQYALNGVRHSESVNEKEKETLQKLIVRTSFGIINAGRNSV